MDIPSEDSGSIWFKVNYKRINEFLKEWNDIRMVTAGSQKEHVRKLYKTWCADTEEILSSFPTVDYSVSGVLRGSYVASRLLRDWGNVTSSATNFLASDEAEIKKRYSDNDIIVLREYFNSQTPETIDVPFCDLKRSQQYTELEIALDWLDGGLPFIV